ncbi:uncharacterized protein LOC133186325 [Saccostrea echinata]|uniref:uncharacterized protein LOC133186325 n=1 Tax=Saccostrea echinata TaxID=191078 RepID=UPI002A805567|nr:uncharacterized protein LOC133186325 [Saccostrea echinata]
MDPWFSDQDVLLCDLCETPVPPMYCDFCHIKLCKACVGEHLSDLSKEHKVVPYKQKGTTPKYPRCQTHVGKLCELHCKECDLPVCLLCLASNFHKGHNLLNLLEVNLSNQEAVEKDLDELLNSISPKYEEISAEIQREKTGLEKHYEKLTTVVIKQGEDWHREINIIVNKQKFEIDEMKTKHLAALNKQEKEITGIISEVKQCILDLKRILDSNCVSLTSAYKSRNVEFRCFPPKVSLPSFSPHQINTEQLHQMFGSLSALSITTDEHGYTMKTPEAEYCPPVKPLLDEPELITTIDTGYKYLYSVTCLSDEEIWTCGLDKIMKLYNLQGKLLKSIQTKSGNTPRDIEVTRSGYLIYTDPNTRTVDIVKNRQIQEVIRLQGWTPHYVCSISYGDFLVTMVSDDDKQSKVVRYSGSTETQTIQFDTEGKPLYSSHYLKYISENRNLDICVADNGAGAVVVVNQAGRLRFRYTGHPSNNKGSFFPLGITTDSQSQILTADCEYHCIHILDQDGQFLRYIDNCNCDLQFPWGLCVDTRDNIFVVELNSGKVKKIKYNHVNSDIQSFDQF